MSQQTVSPARIERAQRALFEALGQIAILERMVAAAREPGQWHGEGDRSLTFADPNARIGMERLTVADELRKMSARLEQIDERLEELKAPRKDERPDPPPVRQPKAPKENP